MKLKLQNTIGILLLISANTIQIYTQDNQNNTLITPIELDEELVRKYLESETPDETNLSKSEFHLPKGANLLSKKENIFYGKMNLYGRTENKTYITLKSTKLNLWNYNAYILKTGCIYQGGGWEKCANSDGYYGTEINVNKKPESGIIPFSGNTTVTYGAMINDFGNIYSDNSGVVFVYLVFIPEEFKIEKYSDTAISIRKGNRMYTITLSSGGRLSFK